MIHKKISSLKERTYPERLDGGSKMSENIICICIILSWNYCAVSMKYHLTELEPEAVKSYASCYELESSTAKSDLHLAGSLRNTVLLFGFTLLMFTILLLLFFF